MARANKTNAAAESSDSPTPVNPAEETATSQGSAAPPEDPNAPSAFVRLINLDGQTATDDEIKSAVNAVVTEALSKEATAERYNVLFLHDDSSIQRSDADKVYRAAASFDQAKPLLLILNSLGGSISSAYFIAKLCREFSVGGFQAAVPRQAKSAATLICCGAERIHMGSLSELGPIDPQFQGIPALAFKYSIEHLAELVKRYPGASEMFANYLAKTLRIEELGYYERVAESATQYAERLLASRETVRRDDAHIREVARRLVYSYKDHGFAIDSREAAEIFGDGVVELHSDEYKLSNRLYGTLDFVGWFLNNHMKKAFYFTGTASDGCTITRLPTSEAQRPGV